MSMDIVKQYEERNFRFVVWPQVGDVKGPTSKGWTTQTYTLKDYTVGDRVGLMCGHAVAPNRYLHDIDIDWQPGSLIAQKFLPPTGFLFGRSSKRLSHCWYLLPDLLPMYRYEDIDKTCLIEFRGSKTNGELGLQTMVPPSIWTKGELSEPLTFIKNGEPAFIEPSSNLKQRVCLAAVGMILARNLGVNGFGHQVRMAWAGFLLRAGIPPEDLIVMGEAMSAYTNNLEIDDVRRTVESVENQLKDPKAKVVGGPSLMKFMAKGRQVLSRINEWLGRDSDFVRDSNGVIVKDSQDNIRRAFTLAEVEFSYDEFAERMLYTDKDTKPKALSDTLNNALWLRIDHEFRFRPSKTFFDIVVENTTRQGSYHPILDYLSGLVWDGIPRLDNWLVTYGKSSNTEYHERVGAIVLIAACRRVRQPGCKYDEMLVLESEQGLNKSSALRALCPREEWFSDDLPLNVDAKQIIERTLGKWIIESSDMAGGRKADRDHLKSMLSRQIDGPARLAYAHFPIERARQFIIIGTTNNAEYLHDSTGARRFWPVRVQKFDVKGIVEDRDQLWAEAAHRESEGESIRLPEYLWSVAEEHQEKRRTVDAWEETIRDAMEELVPTSTGKKTVATVILWDLLQIPMERRDRSGSLRIGEIMQRLGYVSTKLRAGGKLQSGYTNETSKGQVRLLDGTVDGE